MRYLLILLTFVALPLFAKNSSSFEEEVSYNDKKTHQISYTLSMHGYTIQLWTPKASLAIAKKRLPHVHISNNDYDFETIYQSRYVKVYGKKGKVASDGTIIFHNGMKNSLTHAIEAAIYTSKLCGDKDVTLIYRGSSSLALDVVEYELNTRGTITPACLLYAACVHECVKNHPKASIMSIHHSLGALQGKIGLKLLSKGERKNVHFLAVAPASFLPRDYCGKLLHILSEDDPIPENSSNNGEYELAKKEGTVKVLSMHDDVPLFDHVYQSPTYQGEILGFWKRYLATQKKIKFTSS